MFASEMLPYNLMTRLILMLTFLYEEQIFEAELNGT
jgi:hypothetical protein